MTLRRGLIVTRMKKRCANGDTYSALADEFGVKPSDIWLAANNDYVSRKLYTSIYPPETERTRICADVSPEEKAVIIADIERHGYDSPTAFHRAWGRGEIRIFVVGVNDG